VGAAISFAGAFQAGLTDQQVLAFLLGSSESMKNRS
jgi:hypothetical protein